MQHEIETIEEIADFVIPTVIDGGYLFENRLLISDVEEDPLVCADEISYGAHIWNYD